MTVKTKKNTYRTLLLRTLLLLLILGLILLAYVFIAPLHQFINSAVVAAQNPQQMKSFVQEHKAYAPLIIFFFTMLQAFIVILPLFIVMMASALVFGLFWGIVISLVCQIIAGYITFLLTRYFGRPFVERFVPQKSLSQFNNVIERYGRWGVLVARIIPFGSFDLVNFGSGIFNVKDRDFLIGTALGCLPATTFYAVLAISFANPASISILYYILVGAFLLMSVLVWFFIRRKKVKPGQEP